MSQAFSHQVHFTSPDQTRQFAINLSRHLKAGDVVLLQGGIGAGKTHFARSVIQERLSQIDALEDVPSPTFTLVQTYSAGDDEIWHADLYRLSHPDEVEELGLVQAFDDAICLVEWPDRLGSLNPESALTLSFDTDNQAGLEDHRVITMSGPAQNWQNRLMSALPV